MLVAAGCARTNPAFAEEAASSSGEQPDPDPKPTTSGGTSVGGTDVTHGATSSPDPEPDPLPTTGVVTDTDAPWFDVGDACMGESVEPCDLFSEECDPDQTCTVLNPTAVASGLGTYCVRPGSAQRGDSCSVRCGVDDGKRCAAGLVCEPFEMGAEGLCAEPCAGSTGDDSCADGVCFSYPELGFGVCRGSCNPAFPETCPAGQVCDLDLGTGVSSCVPLGGPQPDNDCSDSVCPAMQVCVFGGQDCAPAACCRPVCVAEDDCADGFECEFAADGGAVADLGYCVPR